MSTATLHNVTAEAFFSLSEAADCELVDGRVVPRNRGAHHDFVSATLARRLYEWATPATGFVFGTFAGYQCFPDSPNRVIRPDVSFLASGRLEGDVVPQGWMRIPPDVAIEVTSPVDRFQHISQRVLDYLHLGVPLVWVVDPTLEEVRAYHRSGAREIVCGEEELRDEAVLPGFSCRVTDIFCELRYDGNLHPSLRPRQ